MEVSPASLLVLLLASVVVGDIDITDCDSFFEVIDSCRGDKPLTDTVIECHPRQPNKMTLECGCAWRCIMRTYGWITEEGRADVEQNAVFYRRCGSDYTPEKEEMFRRLLTDCEKNSVYEIGCEKSGDVLQCIARQSNVTLFS
ncbi:uncharacterized protein LOC134534477 [Bacillus rossius redtenbacheri]|uniref:uncharacterized protein LOC134534477 n=1 Tax=Bacillus rossius redtenbacheri TaxID=93214 RepID=UPI002FDCA648